MLRHNIKALAVGVGMGVCAAGAGLVALKKCGLLDYALDCCYDVLDNLYEVIHADEEEYDDYVDEMEINHEESDESEGESDESEDCTPGTETRSTINDAAEEEAAGEDYTVRAFAHEMLGAFQKFCEEHPLDNYLKHYAAKCNEGIDKLHCVADGVLETARESKQE